MQQSQQSITTMGIYDDDVAYLCGLADMINATSACCVSPPLPCSSVKVTRADAIRQQQQQQQRLDLPASNVVAAPRKRASFSPVVAPKKRCAANDDDDDEEGSGTKKIKLTKRMDAVADDLAADDGLWSAHPRGVSWGDVVKHYVAALTKSQAMTALQLVCKDSTFVLAGGSRVVRRRLA